MHNYIKSKVLETNEQGPCRAIMGSLCKFLNKVISLELHTEGL